MLNAKLLAASGVLAASTWKVWTDPRWLSVLLNVVGALLISWLVFLCVFYLTALHVRRASQRAHGVPQRHRHTLRARVPTH